MDLSSSTAPINLSVQQPEIQNRVPEEVIAANARGKAGTPVRVKRSTAPKRKIDVQKLVEKAVKTLESDKGCTLTDIKKHLKDSKHQLDDPSGIKLGLQNAIDGGALVKVNGKYKVTERARRRRRRSSGGSRRRRRSSGRKRRSRSRRRSGSKRRSSRRRRRRSKKAIEE